MTYQKEKEIYIYELKPAGLPEREIEDMHKFKNMPTKSENMTTRLRIERMKNTRN